jgi:hypothetical protein
MVDEPKENLEKTLDLGHQSLERQRVLKGQDLEVLDAAAKI